VDTDTTPFAGKGIHPRRVLNRLKAAQLLTFPALRALRLIDDGGFAASKFLPLSNGRIDEQMKIRSIDITIG
jgi:hypothetical protein